MLSGVINWIYGFVLDADIPRSITRENHGPKTIYPIDDGGNGIRRKYIL